MAQTIEGSDSQTERVNELYWSGSMTVDDIVEEVGISRTGLYSSIEPVSAGIVCADCHERMVFTNRTMRDRGVAVCPSCGRESEPGETEAARGGRASTGEEDAVGAGAQTDTLDRLRDTLRSVPPTRIALVGGGAALGIIVGALTTGLLREGF